MKDRDYHYSDFVLSLRRSLLSLSLPVALRLDPVLERPHGAAFQPPSIARAPSTSSFASSRQWLRAIRHRLHLLVGGPTNPVYGSRQLHC